MNEILEEVRDKEPELNDNRVAVREAVVEVLRANEDRWI